MNVGPDWLNQEMLWHAYYLRAMATDDDYFQSRILSQGCAYQYMMGMNIAARDPLQHILPMVYLEPGLARDVLRYTLSEMDGKGFIPYGIKGVGVRTAGGNPFPSDTELYLLLATSEYILATRDFAFLDEDLPYYPRESGAHGTVREHLKLAYRHLIEGVGIGAHGLVKLRNSDWSDPFLAQEKEKDPKLDLEQVEREGESTLNTALAAYVLPRFAGVARQAGDEDWAAAIEAQGAAFREALLRQWNCRWFTRALLPNGAVVGSDRPYLEPQPWAILAGALDPAAELMLDETLHAELSAPSPIGAMSLPPPGSPVAGPYPPAGRDTDGGVWYSLRMPLIMAFARLRPDLAWEEFLKMTLRAHARAYPNTWVGQWSGPDSYTAYYNPRPGEAPDLLPFSGAMSDFPIMCGHAHAVPWFDLIKLMGIEPTPDGFVIDPKIPGDRFSLATELIELRREPGLVQGAITPLGPGPIKWRVRADSIGRVLVQGQPVAWQRDGGFAIFSTSAKAGERTEWRLECR